MIRRKFRQIGGSLVSFFFRFRGEFLVSVSAGIFLTFLFFILGSLDEIFGGRSKFEGSLFILQVTIMVLLFYLAFNTRRLFNKQIDTASNLFYDFFGYSWQANQYFKRKQHFVLEKDTLCHILVENVLPNLLDSVLKNTDRPIRAINIIIDSGTTLSPAFRYLPAAEFARNRQVPVKIHTNNIAGTEEMHRVDPRHWTFDETDFFLIDGNPLGRYRATTYENPPHPYLGKLWQAGKNGGTVNIGVVTGNWILGGSQLTKLTLCAKGRGHPEFKEEVVDNCDFLIVVAPLAKILKLDRVANLNELLPREDGSYQPIVIPREKKMRTILLTTLRGVGSQSPLAMHAENLRDKLEAEMKRGDVTENFCFCERTIDFNPPGSRHEVARLETPHGYLLGKNFRVAYGYDMWQSSA